MRTGLSEYLVGASAVAYRLALLVSGSEGDAMSIVESAYQNVMRHSPRCPSPTCVERLILREVYTSSLATAGNPTPSMSTAAESCSMTAALSGLSAPCRAIFSLWSSRFRYQEIAEIVGLPLDSVAALLVEAVEHLKQALDLESTMST